MFSKPVYTENIQNREIKYKIRRKRNRGKYNNLGFRHKREILILVLQLHFQMVEIIALHTKHDNK